jgi:hypothetical protein
MRVSCEIEETTLEGDYSSEVEGVMATCSRCGDVSEAFGTGEASVRRCLMGLREGCSWGEQNFYFAADGSDGG